jgi:hypothetical protein
MVVFPSIVKESCCGAGNHLDDKNQDNKPVHEDFQCAFLGSGINRILHYLGFMAIVDANTINFSCVPEDRALH